jgi:mannose/cellobiose epimerase-like protein (N-acyl-D-glucosamine 2-epimerase family)
MVFSSYSQSLTVAGTVDDVYPAKRSFQVSTRSEDVFEVCVGPTTSYEVMTNIDGLRRDRVPPPAGVSGDDPVLFDLLKYVHKGTKLWVEGIYQENANQRRYEARTVYLLHSGSGKLLFEETHWWLVQISQMTDRWLDQLFEKRRNYELGDFAEFYRTNLNITGGETDDTVQECATLSRLIYGLSSAYLITGAERYLLAARAGVAYQREAFRSLSHDGQYCFWSYGRRSGKAGETLIVPSQNGDDFGTIPLYEQIYALAGLAQYYRITLDWEVLEDIRRTVNTFQDYYWDPPEAREKWGYAGTGGYYSHLDYVTMRPDSAGLGDNQSRKNWNSIGDHIPAYLVNLILALDPLPKGQAKRNLEGFRDVCRGILEETSKLICEKFPDRDSDFVNERFHADWRPDQQWRWQQNRAVVGHDLKISWNLTRCAFYFQSLEKHHRDRKETAKADDYKERSDLCLAVARKLADRMAEVGLDKLRGGIFDAVERQPTNGMPTQFAWGNTKDFWQQEQGILAYLILHGAVPGDTKYLELARECLAFWNLFFLDRDRQGIFFRTTENGLPFLRGMYANKGGHSVSGYHAFELNYLAHHYIRTFVISDERDDNNFCLYFKIAAGCGQESINVLPDFVPPGQVRIHAVRFQGCDRSEEVVPPGPNEFQIAIPAEYRGRETEIVVEFASLPA